MRSMHLYAFLLLAGIAAAQEPTVYRLNFAIRETESGKTISTHNHTLLIAPDTNATLRVGTKVPVPAGPNSQQFTYIDVGVNLRAKVQERGSSLLVNADVEASNLGAERESTGHPAPQIQSLHTTIDTAVPFGKPTPVVMLDDPATPRHYEIEVTATKVK
jgi:hypothetical protein